jgi:hypothetical protein
MAMGFETCVSAQIFAFSDQLRILGGGYRTQHSDDIFLKRKDILRLVASMVLRLSKEEKVIQQRLTKFWKICDKIFPRHEMEKPKS